MVRSRKKSQPPHDSQTSTHALALMKMKGGTRPACPVKKKKKQSGTETKRPSRVGTEDIFNRMVASAGQWFGAVVTHHGGRNVACIRTLLQTKLDAVLNGSPEARAFLDERDQELVQMMVLVEHELKECAKQPFQRRVRDYKAEFKQAFAPTGINATARIALVREAASKAGVYENRIAEIRANRDTLAELAAVKAELATCKARCQHFEDLVQKLQQQITNDQLAPVAGDEEAH